MNGIWNGFFRRGGFTSRNADQFSTLKLHPCYQENGQDAGKAANKRCFFVMEVF